MPGQDSPSPHHGAGALGDAAAALDRFTKGGIYPEAERRLREVVAGRAPFNAPGELGSFALASAAELQSLGLVTGIAVSLDAAGGVAGYVKPGAFREFHHFNAKWSAILQRAVGRLRAEAGALGATVVVGATLSHEPVDLADDDRGIKYLLTGNAMRSTVLHAGADPVLTNLSAADYWTLLKAGSRPLGLCITSGAFIARMTRATVRIARSGAHPRTRGVLGRRVAPSQALPDVSEAVIGVRDQLMTELEGQARGFGAAGIVNLNVELDIKRPQPSSKFFSSHSSHYWLMGHALATAISSRDRRGVEPRPVISLNGTLS